MARSVPDAYMATLQDIDDLVTDLLSEGLDMDPLERDPMIRELIAKTNALMELIKEAT